MSEGIGEPNIFSQKNPRIPRKKGQPAKSDKHSDLYTDEDPRGTIHGLGFKDVETANQDLKNNYKIFKDKGYDSWVCPLLDEGITFL